MTKLQCRDFGKDKVQNEHNGEFELLIETENEIYDIRARRALDIRFCQALVNDIKSILKGEEHFCVGVGFFPTKERRRGKVVNSWIFDKFRTKKGCVSYFEGDCSAERWRPFGYPDRPKSSVPIR